MPGGRPTKYKPSYPQELLDYFNIPAGEDKELENSKGQMQVVRIAADLPTFAGFACKIDVRRETLQVWSTETDKDGKLKKPEFSNAYKKAKDHQERILVENGLKGGYQTAFAIFTAKNVLGWRDKHELSQSDDTATPLDISFTVLPAVKEVKVTNART